MKKIGDILVKFKVLSLPDESLRRRISETLQQVLALSVDIKDISIKKSIAYIKTGSATKSEIFLNKSRILSALPPEVRDIR